MGSNYTFLITLSVIFVGYILKRAGKLTEELGKNLSIVVINVTLPALILSTIPTIELDRSLVIAALISIIFSVAMVFLSKRLFRKDKNEAEAVLNSLGFNIGLFAYPIIEGLFGKNGLKTIAMFDFGNAIIVFGVVYLVCYGYSSKGKDKPLNKKRILTLFLGSLPFMSYIVAIGLNIMDLTLPRLVGDTVLVLSKANMGLVLLVLGLNLNFTFEKSEWKIILKVLALRYSTGLSIGLLLFFTLPFSLLYRTVILFGLILPVPVVVVPYSVEFGFNSRLSGTIANFTIIISFIIMWLAMIIIF